MLQKLFGQRAGHLWGRSFRMMTVITALVGGLSTQWYGCGGLTDYERLEKDRQLMFQKSTEQVAGAINYSKNFLVFAAGLGAVAFAILGRGRKIEQELQGSTLETRNNLKTSNPSVPNSPHINAEQP
jgi:hypothetical protein